MSAEVKCQFGSATCICQWCEDPCNNGLECWECEKAGKQEHDHWACTGFVGTYPNGVHSDEITRKAEEYLARNP